jgi:iron complex transport system substrate-binding protein
MGPYRLTQAIGNETSTGPTRSQTTARDQNADPNPATQNIPRTERKPVSPLTRPRPPRPGGWRAVWLVGTVVVLGAVLVACGSSSHSSTSSSTAGSSTTVVPAGYPVTVSDCGSPVTFTQAPTRAVSNDINTTEDMIALVLESHMVGEFAASGSLPANQGFPAEFTAGFKQIHEISSDYFTLEQLVGQHPDFLFAGWNYGLQTGTNLTPDNLAKYGIKTLALTESCAHVQASKQSVSVDDTYQDLTDLGQIFDVPQKARQVINSMKTEIASVQSRVASLPAVTVFDYDSGTAAPFTGPGLAMPNAEITLGGGTNIFAGLKQSWTSVSWEQVVKADPQCIIVNDYGTPTAAQKEEFLETSPITKNLIAVKNRCFLPLTYDEVAPSPRNGEAIVAIAHWLHPSAFGLPADGS